MFTVYTMLHPLQKCLQSEEKWSDDRKFIQKEKKDKMGKEKHLVKVDCSEKGQTPHLNMKIWIWELHLDVIRKVFSFFYRNIYHIPNSFHICSLYTELRYRQVLGAPTSRGVWTRKVLPCKTGTSAMGELAEQVVRRATNSPMQSNPSITSTTHPCTACFVSSILSHFHAPIITINHTWMIQSLLSVVAIFCIVPFCALLLILGLLRSGQTKRGVDGVVVL